MTRLIIFLGIVLLEGCVHLGSTNLTNCMGNRANTYSGGVIGASGIGDSEEQAILSAKSQLSHMLNTKVQSRCIDKQSSLIHKAQTYCETVSRSLARFDLI